MPINRVTILVLLFLLIVPAMAVPVNAQVCGRTDIPMRLRIWIEMIDDPEGFLQGDPEFFADVIVNGVLECDDIGYGNGSSQNDGPLDCVFDIAPPYDPFTVEIWVQEDDDLFGGTRDTLDVSSDLRAGIVFEYNPQCNRLISTNPDMFGG
ncbi:MAG: hypothetical protein IFK94_15855, partial [Acidobacteria bacterium]|nr:hypothetical protein [Candidatus Polarisedimenticola svalbardensis]